MVISSKGVLNKDGLRHKDEFVRHKVLDAVGDLYTAGGLIRGSYKGVRSGHSLTNKLLRALFSDKKAWRYIDLGKKASPDGILNNHLTEECFGAAL